MFFAEQHFLFDKTQGIFFGSVDAMARRKLGLKHWNNQHIGKILSAALGK